MSRKSSKFLPEVRERAVRPVREQRGEHSSIWAAVESIAPMIGCTPQALLDWVKRSEVGSGERYGVGTAERERIKALEREVRELQVGPSAYRLTASDWPSHCTIGWKP